FQLLYLTILQAPATILVLTPFIFLFGTLGAFVGLNRRSELIAMRAAGVSAWRFILPAAVAAFVIGVLTITLLNP
ncbi:MAG TPA: LptF/LptG family permease, partial [Caulobacter sp.]|nr:LptF/LptG family permease [Caulobacter sp.]